MDGSPIGRQRADWGDLRLFWAVVESGSFSAAARALGMTQPTVTRRIDDLETRLGALLLIRSAQGVRLTEAGEMVYDQVLTMERSAASIEHLVVSQDRKEEGQVGIACPDGVAGFVIAPAIAAFLRENPAISLALDCGLWPEQPIGVNVDVALQFAQPAHPDAIARPLAHFHFCLFASRQYLDIYGTPTSLQEVPVHRYVHHSAQTHEKQLWREGTPSLPALSNTRLITNSSAASLMAVKSGAGIGMMATAVAAIEPELVMLEIAPLVSLPLWMCYHRDVGGSARVKKVVEWLTELFDARGQPWYRKEFVHPRDFGRAQVTQLSHWSGGARRARSAAP